MKFNRIKNTLKALLLVSCTFSGISYGMERDGSERRLIVREESREQNLLAPYVNAAASLAVARYVPEITESVLPRMSSNPLANALIPQAIKYGAYGLGAHFVLRNGLGINYTDFMKTEYLKKIAHNAAKTAPLALCHPEVVKTAAHYGTQFASKYISNTAAAAMSSPHMKPAMIATGALTAACLVNPNLAPATLCHPEVAKLAADCCTNFASSYLSDSQLQIFDTYAAPAFMTAGALGTLYLVNRNIFKGQLLKKVKKVCKDVRPYLFMAPLATAYNADTVKNYAMSYVSPSIGANLHSDLGSGVKAGIYWGSIGLATYLFATESIGLANQGYVKKQIDKLLKTCSQIGGRISQLTTRMNNTQSSANQIRTTQTEQAKALNEFADKTTLTMADIATLLQKASLKHGQTTQAVEALEILNTNLHNEALSISTIAAEIAQNIALLREDHAKKIEQFKRNIKENGEEVLKLIAQKDKEVEAKIALIEQACTAEVTQLEELAPKLTELLKLLHAEGQIYHIDQERIEGIVRVLAQSSQSIEDITKELSDMHATMQTPGAPVDDSKAQNDK